jgi:PHD/YefM family antitoxin component YafN of YafNO toxin-antitoxin module
VTNHPVLKADEVPTKTSVTLDADVFLEQNGEVMAVVMPYKRYQALMERLEFLEDSLAAIEALESPEPTLSLDELMAGLAKS